MHSMKILISTPSYQHQVNNEMVMSLLRVIEDLKKNNIAVNWHSPTSSQLAFNRNIACDLAIKDQYDFLLFWDGDISVQEPHFVREMIQTSYKHDASVVGLPVVLKGSPKTYNCIIGGGTNLTKVEDRPFEVSRIGTGVMLIRTALLKSMIPPWFQFTEGYNQQPTCTPEDWGFCSKIKEEKIFADPRFHVQHWGLYAYES
jgi:hypothetical protein